MKFKVEDEVNYVETLLFSVQNPCVVKCVDLEDTEGMPYEVMDSNGLTWWVAENDIVMYKKTLDNTTSLE